MKSVSRMLNRPMPVVVGLFFMVLLASSGCRSAQVSKNEPHGILTIKTDGTQLDPVYRVFTGIDGNPVPLVGKAEYRLAPGVHRVTFREVRTDSRTFRLGSAGSGAVNPVYFEEVKHSAKDPADTSAVDAFGNLDVRWQAKTQKADVVTLTVKIVAGGRYVSDGYGIRETTRR